MATAREPQAIPVLREAARLLAVLDALVDAGAGDGLVPFFDRDGSLVEAARAWCGSHDVPLVEELRETELQTWTRYAISFGRLLIVIHDQRTIVRRAPDEQMGAGHA